jgi:hypothetical protein
LDRQSLKADIHNGVGWIPYDATKSRLLVTEKACLKTVGEMINNDGKLR